MPAHQWDLVADEVNFNLAVDLTRFKSEVSINAKILEFGCGYGRISQQLMSLGYANVNAIDSSKKMIERGVKENPDIQFTHMSGHTIPFEDNYFDAVVVCAVFTCIVSHQQRENCIDEIRRVLKPTGVLHLVEFCASNSRAFMSKLQLPMWYGTAENYLQLVKGFQLLQGELLSAKTMNGRQVQSYSLFAKKLNERAISLE